MKNGLIAFMAATTFFATTFTTSYVQIANNKDKANTNTYTKYATYYDGQIITEDEMVIEYRSSELDNGDTEKVIKAVLSDNNTPDDTTDDYIISYEDITDQVGHDIVIGQVQEDKDGITLVENDTVYNDDFNYISYKSVDNIKEGDMVESDFYYIGDPENVIFRLDRVVNKSVATLQSNGLYMDNLGYEWYLEDANSTYALVEYENDGEYVSHKELKEVR